MDQQKKYILRCECKECEGTGIYVGAYCHDGAGMVCKACGGKGYQEIPYNPFTERKTRDDIVRVFPATSFGTFYTSVHVFPDDTMLDYSQFGCSYEDWLKGETPKPMPANFLGK